MKTLPTDNVPPMSNISVNRPASRLVERTERQEMEVLSYDRRDTKNDERRLK